jgi:hypothetical protein
MTTFEEFVAALNWILDTPAARRNLIDPSREPSWHLEFLTSKQFMAKTSHVGDEFLIQVSNSVWPCLEAFCACGIDWKGNARGPRRKTFQYSQEEWGTIIGFTDDFLNSLSSITDAVARSRMLDHSVATKRVRMPLGTFAPSAKVHAAAAFYGMLWLIGHEGTHAWRRHFQLDEGGRQSIREESELLQGGELQRTWESEADWQAAKFVFAYVLECIVAGYRDALAYAAGFGVAAAVLLLNPCRHDLFDGPLDHDPGWMRLHFLAGAAKAGYWTIVDAHYPAYKKLMGLIQSGAAMALGHEPSVVKPSARFEEASDATQKMFWTGIGDAQRFAIEIGEANSTYQVAPPGHFKFGELCDWKEFQVQTIETDVLGRREQARKELRRLLPSDPRFQEAGPLGSGALLRMMLLAALRKRRVR